MVAVAARPTGNTLVDLLPRRQRLDFVNACELVELTLGEAVCHPGEVIRHVYFPTSGFISLITPPGASDSLEVGLVGREGSFGLTILLDINTSALLGLTQGDGAALRIPAEQLRRRVKDSVELRKVVHRYLYVLMAQVAQTAACGRFHLLEARLARWLLMTHDRARGDSFRITHAFLADMLGVRRAGVSTTARRLQDEELIAYTRGVVKVLDRKGLESFSCPCYQAFNEMYETHLLVDHPTAHQVHKH
jgi:CRP-like cAMP-binding protein